MDFDGIVFDRQALEDFYFNSTTANTTTSDLRQRTSTVSPELDLPDIGEVDDDISTESEDDDEASTLLAVSNTRPFYVDHHLQTAITREAQLVNRLKKFREK